MMKKLTKEDNYYTKVDFFKIMGIFNVFTEILNNFNKIYSQNHQGETIPEPEFNQFAEFPWLHFPCTRN